MTFWEKRDAVLADLTGRGVRPSAAAPWLYRGLWAAGVPVRPPYYQTFAGLFVTHALFYWLLMAVGGAVVTVGVVGPPALPVAVAISAVVAGVNGTVAAAAAGQQARKLRLPRWDAFDPYQPDPNADW